MGLEALILIDDAAIDRAAGIVLDELTDRGLVPGTRLAILSGNHPAFLVARRALAAGRFVAVPINPRLAPPEMKVLLSRALAAGVLCEPPLSARLLGSSPARIEVNAAATGQISGRSQRALADSTGEVGATLLFTSGTTGEPKGCVRPADVERARAHELIATYGLGSSDIHLVACPLAHSAPGILSRAARLAGARTALLSRFSPEAFLAAVQQCQATVFFLVPTQIDRLLALPPEIRARYDLSHVRAAIVAGAPFSRERKRAAIAWLGEGRLWEFYGSSETGTITVMPPGEHARQPGSVGRAVTGVELRLLDPQRRPVPTGVVGEIFVRSPTVMTGYLDESEDAGIDGFVSVGDLGRLDSDGYLTLVDRVHDTIISGGVNIHPAEVERALTEHPAVQGAIVFGLPDDDWGEIVAAAVATSATADELRRFLRERIASFKVPKSIVIVALDELPIGPSGKPLRRVARERFSRNETGHHAGGQTAIPKPTNRVD